MELIEKLKKIIELIDENIYEIEVKTTDDGESIRITRTAPASATPLFATPAAPAMMPTPPAAGPAPAATPVKEQVGTPVLSPMVGTFYAAANPDAKPYVRIGDKVNAGETLCIIEAMKMFNEIEAEVSGTVVECAVENGQPVEFHQVLFRVQEN